MKKLLLSFVAIAAMGFTAVSQTVLFSEDFETGGSSFNLNTATEGGQVGLAGDNAWVVNSAYTGGSGTSSCFGFGFSIGNTPAQPAGISSQNGNYMHILSDDGSNNGIMNANYSAADGSFCFFAQSHFTEMGSDISTVGYTNVELNFWWTCLGDVSAHGQVYYSTDGGTSWTQVTAPVATYYGSSSWANQSITNAAWDNQATLRFGFRFNNQVAASGGDPSFSIDDVKILGSTGASNAITTGTNLTPATWCEGTATAIQVDFTSTGTFTAGNVYTAELSDAAGSFASPLAIGTLTSTANSGTINATVPGSVAAGSGYRIRVVSDSPVTVGSDNGSDLTINALPAVTQQAFTDVCENAAPVNLVGGSPAGGSYSGTGVSGIQFDPSVLGVGQTDITYSYTDGNGCTGTAVEPITVLAAPTVTLSPFADVCDNDPFFTLTGGSPSNGTYTGPGVTGGVFDPSAAGAGTHTITYSYTDGTTGCSGTASETIFVDACDAISENEIKYFSMFPNPAKGAFEITTDATIESVELRDMSGRLVRVYSGEQASYSIENIPTGIYVVTVATAQHVSQQRLMVK